MSDRVFTGAPGPTEVDERFGSDKEGGPFRDRIWEGPTRDSVLAIIDDLAGEYDNWFIERAGNKWRAVARFSIPQDGSAELPVDSVRLIGNRLNETLYGLPEFAAVAPADIWKIQQ